MIQDTDAALMVENPLAGSSSPLFWGSRWIRASHTKWSHLCSSCAHHSGKKRHSGLSQCSSCTSTHLEGGEGKKNLDLYLIEKSYLNNIVLNCCIDCFTFAQGSTIIHTFVIVLVVGAEVGIVVVAQGVSSIPAVVGNKEFVAVELITHSEKAILSIACLSVPVLHRKTRIPWIDFYRNWEYWLSKSSKEFLWFVIKCLTLYPQECICSVFILNYFWLWNVLRMVNMFLLFSIFAKPNRSAILSNTYLQLNPKHTGLPC